MSTGSGVIAGSEAAQDAARAYAKVRGAGDIQYAPVPIPKNPPLERPPTEVPEWLKAIGEFFAAIGRFLRAIFEPLGHALGMSWPVLQWVVIGLAVLGVLALLYTLVEPLRARRKVEAEAEPEWAPGQAAAVALLDEADRLAGEGNYAEATHLLLQRSVSQIERARPGLLPPASTAREIAVHPALPLRARAAFGAISARVERSLFALRRLDAGDWSAARAAYADFALARLDTEAA